MAVLNDSMIVINELNFVLIGEIILEELLYRQDSDIRLELTESEEEIFADKFGSMFGPDIAEFITDAIAKNGKRITILEYDYSNGIFIAQYEQKL